MKILKLTARLFGSIALLSTFNACDKDGDSSGCCSYSYKEDGTTYTYEVCKDGTGLYTARYADGSTYSYSYDTNWEEYFDSWSDVEDNLTDDGWKC